MPVEFSVAAFRFGHSEVRGAYELSELTNDNPIPVFSFADPVRTLAGGRPIPSGFGVDWAYFFDIEGAFDDLGNLSRLFDPKIAQSLFQLPIPGSEAEGSNVLAFRTMNRGLFYGLPSGQAVARALKATPITPEALNLGPGFERGTPLWYYVLAEAEQVESGKRLGPVGGSIVADVLLTALAKTPGSVLQRPFKPTVPHAGAFTMGDLLLFAGAFSQAQLKEHLDEQAEEGGEARGGDPGGEPDARAGPGRRPGAVASDRRDGPPPDAHDRARDVAAGHGRRRHRRVPGRARPQPAAADDGDDRRRARGADALRGAGAGVRHGGPREPGGAGGRAGLDAQVGRRGPRRVVASGATPPPVAGGPSTGQRRRRSRRARTCAPASTTRAS